MRKQYNKPVFMIESFTLTQSVAAGCGITQDSTLGFPNHYNKSTCGWDMGNFSVWTDPEHKCEDVFLDPDDDTLGICYNNPDGQNTIFNSI